MADSNNTIPSFKEQEEWKPIPNFTGYDASNMGQIRSHPKKTRKGIRILEGSIYIQGKYKRKYINLCKNGKIYIRGCHNLVLITFCGPCPKGFQCLHRNGNALDNRLSNLHWGTALENSKDREKHGNTCRGERIGSSKLTENIVREIRRRHSDGDNAYDMADEFKTSASNIYHIINKLCWKHVI